MREKKGSIREDIKAGGTEVLVQPERRPPRPKANKALQPEDAPEAGDGEASCGGPT